MKRKKRDSNLCKQLVFVNSLLRPFILAIFAILSSLAVLPVLVGYCLGVSLVVLEFVVAVLIDRNAICKYCHSPLKEDKVSWSMNPQWKLYNDIWSGKLVCPRCGKKL